MSKTVDRDESRKSPISYRWLLASLLVHGLVLLTLTRFTGGHGPGHGKAGRSQDDALTVTWIPGSGDAAGASGVDTVVDDTVVDDAEQGEPNGTAIDVEVGPEPEKKPVFEVAETDPSKVFDEAPGESVLVSFDLNGARPQKSEPVEPTPEESDRNERPRENTVSNQESNGDVPTGPRSSNPDRSDSQSKVAGTNLGKGRDGSSLGNGSNGVKFFGIFSRARKVVYVIDASESMRKHNAMEIARTELLQSLKGLEQTAQFQVIFFDAQPHVMAGHRGGTKLMLANPRNLVQAEHFAKGIQPESGTNRFAALTIALAFKPDVIFLLTDADEPKLTRQELFDLRRANSKRHTSINVVEFGIQADLSADSFLKQLAHENAGQHFYRDLTKQ